MNRKRILLGLAATVVFGLVADELISLSDFAVNSVLQSVALGFVATAIGGFIARRGFVIPALGLWFLEWLLVICALYSVAAPTGQASFLAITQINLLSIVLSALAVAIGALLGQGLARGTHRGTPAF